MIADCKRPIVAGRYQSQKSCPIRQAGRFLVLCWCRATAARLLMLIKPLTFFWRTLLAKNRHQGLEAKAS